MMPRITTIALCLLWTVAAYGFDVAPDLQDALTGKLAGETVPVMLLLPDHADLEALETTLAGLSPTARRNAVIDAMRSHAATAEAPAREALARAAAGGRIENVRSVYVAGALLFDADAAAVAILAADRAEGLMHHDQDYDLLQGVLERRTGDDGSAATAAADKDAAAIVWNVSWINAPAVWSLGYDGGNVVVGHIDSGVWLAHSDLANRLWVNPGEIPGNGIDDDGNGFIDDVHGYDFGDNDGNPNDDSANPGHGTHTAGTVVGDGTGGTETGVAPGARLMALKAFNSAGSGTLGNIWQAYQYAMENGARVITMSLGVPGSLPASLMRSERETCNVLRTAGLLIFNSAGNDHFNYTPPIECGLTARVPPPWNPIAGTPYTSTSGVVAVGGTGYLSDTGYSSSSRGPVRWGDVDPWNDWPYSPGPGLTKPDVSAPAVNVNSTIRPSGYSGNSWSGTSMACPHAAGLAALMLHKNPSLSPAGIDSIMELTAVDLGTAGKDNQFGSGRINALAAVNMVPATQTPHLTWISFAIQDAGGDGVIDPGEDFDIVFTLVNNSPLVDAVNVQGGLVTVAGGPVAVSDGAGSFGTIALGGGTGTNGGDVFSLTCDPGAAQGATFTMLLTVTAQNGYEKTFDVKASIGLPMWRTHDAGNVLATVTATGSLGYTNQNQVEGVGFGPAGGNGLFIGSFWGGINQSYICNHDYDEGSYDWVVVTSPNGRVRDLGAVVSDQDYQAMFADAGHASPRNVVVTQESFAFAGAPNDDFVILRYTVRNDGATTVSAYHTGVFCDFDVADAGANLGATDAARRLTYMYPSGGGAHFGIALLEPTTARNLTLISNPTYVYPNGYITEDIKARHLRGLISLATTPSADDWSALTSAGPVDIAPGGEIVHVYALVWGANLADLQANTEAAQAVDLSGLTPVAGGGLPSAFALAQNAPNPFNPQTTIVFAVDRQTQVRLQVYDLQGKLVRRLTDQVYAPGEHRLVWDGRDQAGAELPSGLYLYRLEDGRRTETRKMVLVR